MLPILRGEVPAQIRAQVTPEEMIVSRLKKYEGSLTYRRLQQLMHCTVFGSHAQIRKSLRFLRLGRRITVRGLRNDKLVPTSVITLAEV